MIVAVTGPSAAGKTTWCRRHHPAETIPEHTPDGSGSAAFWADVNSRRWLRAVDQERLGGLAVCDDDPMKLHYSWSLARIGAAPWADWDAEVAAHRAVMAAGALGFADLILVSLPSREELRRRRDADTSRRRRNFDLHVRLTEPLREWYEAVESTGAADVRWELPAGGLPPLVPPPRDNRCDPAALDAVVAALGPLRGAG